MSIEPIISEMKVREIRDIPVPSNPTTGYFPCLAQLPDCLDLISSVYIPHHPQIIGSGGSQVFKIIAVAKGKGELSFDAIRYSDPLDIKPLRKVPVEVKE